MAHMHMQACMYVHTCVQWSEVVRTHIDRPAVPLCVRAQRVLAKTIELEWDAPLHDGGGGITSYQVALL